MLLSFESIGTNKTVFSFADLPKETLKIVLRGLISLISNLLYIFFFSVFKNYKTLILY